MRKLPLILVLMALGCATEPGTGQLLDPVDDLVVPDVFTSVVVSPVADVTAPVRMTDGSFRLVYELWLTNAGTVPATIDQIEVLDFDDPTRVLTTITGQELADATRQLNRLPFESDTLEPNESALVLFALRFENESELPDRIVHRLSGTGADSPASTAPAPISYLAAPWDVSTLKVPSIGPPLAGPGWLVVNGCCSDTGAHRTAVLPVDGRLFNPQRFAIDWVQLDANGRLVNGDPEDVNNWNAYGAPILAVGDGTVVEILDGLPDQIPGSLPDPTTLTVQNAEGNHILLDLGNDVFVLYAHIKAGTMRVQEGDRVSRGDVLAELGNSGNSSAPHLHIHLVDRPSAIASNGIPYVFDRFQLEGGLDPETFSAADLTGVFVIEPIDNPGPHENELPLDLRVIDFPEISP